MRRPSPAIRQISLPFNPLPKAPFDGEFVYTIKGTTRLPSLFYCALIISTYESCVVQDFSQFFCLDIKHTKSPVAIHEVEVAAYNILCV